MHVDSILSWAVGFLSVWLAATLLHAAWVNRDRKYDPLPAEPIEHHHHDHDDHAHGPADHQNPGHDH